MHTCPRAHAHACAPVQQQGVYGRHPRRVPQQLAQVQQRAGRVGGAAAGVVHRQHLGGGGKGPLVDIMDKATACAKHTVSRSEYAPRMSSPATCQHAPKRALPTSQSLAVHHLRALPPELTSILFPP